MSLLVERLATRLEPNPRRVLLRPFDTSGPAQARNVLSRVLALPEGQVQGLLDDVLAEFGERHREVRKLMGERFSQLGELLSTDQDISEPRRALVGSYFLAEYALESAALFNPSIVTHPDQSGLPKGSLRIILSLRSTGEGHISSITFRSGTIDRMGAVCLDEPSPFVVEPKIIPNPLYEKALFGRKLYELGLANTFARQVVDQLEEHFTMEQLHSVIDGERWRRRNLATVSTDEDALWEARILSLAISNYQVEFREDQQLSERIIFPTTPSQRNGIEDARFVRFQEGADAPSYYATYTAYDGRLILPQLVETDDFRRFRFITLNGPAVQNKGMALFPRKVNGHYAMLSRQDGENIHLMFSDNIHFWYASKVIVRPRYPWELVQIGNCGSPIETEVGWLVLSHGVGPMRKYCIGAFLLDLEKPHKVIGRLSEPLLLPTEAERDGYVPNVVYSCGALVHGGKLILPYAMSDSATRFATVDLAALLAALT